MCDKYENVSTPVNWHLIGHLQTNKVKYIVDKACLIHSVDSIKLAKEIEKEATKKNVVANILIQVNIAHEDTKFGIDENNIYEILDEIKDLHHLKVKGLMTIPPICESSLELEKYFEKMSNYYKEIKNDNYSNFDFEILSMGMSGDYKEAILHGSNLVRVGSAIFGARNYK